MEQNEIIEKLNEEINSLKIEIEKLKEEKEIHLTAIAGYENKIQIAKKEAQHSFNISLENVLSDFIPSIEELNLALKTLSNSKDQEGISLIIKNLKQTIGRYGVEEVSPQIGEDFNCDFHEAIAEKEDSENIGKVLEIVKNGYKRNGKPIVTAMVVVGK